MNIYLLWGWKRVFFYLLQALKNSCTSGFWSSFVSSCCPANFRLYPEETHVNCMLARIHIYWRATDFLIKNKFQQWQYVQGRVGSFALWCANCGSQSLWQFLFCAFFFNLTAHKKMHKKKVHNAVYKGLGKIIVIGKWQYFQFLLEQIFHLWYVFFLHCNYTFRVSCSSCNIVASDLSC